MNIERFEDMLAESGLDGVIASSLENVSYLSGARIVTQRLIPDRLVLLLWPGQGDPAIVLCKGEDVACRDDCRIEDMRTYKEFVTPPVDLLADVVVEKGLARGRLGVERYSLPAAFMDRLHERLPGATLVDCGDLMDRARMIKTPEEIDALAEGGRATDRAIRAAFERATVGDPEKRVADDIAAGVTSAGADVLNFMFLGTGTRSFEWHARPDATRLEVGHTLHTDVGGSFTGYWSDVARTAFVGRPARANATSTTGCTRFTSRRSRRSGRACERAICTPSARRPTKRSAYPSGWPISATGLAWASTSTPCSSRPRTSCWRQGWCCASSRLTTTRTSPATTWRTSSW